MQIYVLDEDGRVVFEYGPDNGRGFHLDAATDVRVKVIKVITTALQFLLKVRRPP
jgi:hypothetical protein